MMKKTALILSLLAASLLALQGCTTTGTVTPTAAPTATAEPAASAEPTATAAETASTELVLTLEQLAQYNGKNGNPAYIAVDGIIYDVTNVPQWKNGDHNGFEAGNDLTEQIKTVSPHGVSKLNGIQAVGKLAD